MPTCNLAKLRASSLDQRRPTSSALAASHSLKRVGVVPRTYSGIDREQVQVMVAEQRDGIAGFDAPPHLAQRRQRLWATIDEITDEDQSPRVGQPCEQRIEAREASLQVADGVGAHGRIVAAAGGLFVSMSRLKNLLAR